MFFVFDAKLMAFSAFDADDRLLSDKHHLNFHDCHRVYLFA